MCGVVRCLQVLEQIKVKKEMDRATLVDVSRTSLRTKVHADLADLLTEVNLVVLICIESKFFRLHDYASLGYARYILRNRLNEDCGLYKSRFEGYAACMKLRNVFVL